MDEIEKLRAAGFSEQEIKEYMARKQPTSLRDELHGGSAEFLQGASLGLGGAVDPAMKQASDAFEKRHSVLGPMLNVAGNAAGALALPVSLGASALGRTLVGAGSGAISAATSGEGTPAERAKRAAVGGGLGGLAALALPPAVGALGRFAKHVARPLRDPAAIIAEAAGPLLPDNASAMVARQEALAPGTAIAASTSPDIPASTRVLGANPNVARTAQEASAARSQKVQEAMNDMSAQYDQLLAGKRAPLDLGKDANIRKVIIAHGMWPGDETIELTAVQGLRNSISGKIQALKTRTRAGKGGGRELHELSTQFNALTDWLKTVAPEIEGLDKDYGVLARARRTEDAIMKNIRQSRKAYASTRAAGIEPGSPGASLPSRGGFIHNLLSPNREKLAEQVNRLLLQPGQIPEELLRARARAAASSQTGLLLPGMLGGQLGQATDLFNYQ